MGDVVLVLADADAARLELHQLRERVLQAAGDRDRHAHAGVEVGELGLGRLARGVDARASLADEQHRQLEARLPESGAREDLRLPSSRAVPDRHGSDAALAGEAQQRLGGGRLLLVRLQEDGLAAGERPDGVHGDELAPRPEARVDAEHRLRPERRLVQQPLHVQGEELRRRGVGPVLEHARHLVLDRGPHVVLEGDPAGVAQHLGSRGVGHRAGLRLEARDEPRLELGVLGRPADGDLQLALRLAAPDREIAVRARQDRAARSPSPGRRSSSRTSSGAWPAPSWSSARNPSRSRRASRGPAAPGRPPGARRGSRARPRSRPWRRRCPSPRCGR